MTLCLVQMSGQSDFAIKARSDRDLDQKKKNSSVEEGLNGEEETTSDLRISMDADGPGI